MVSSGVGEGNGRIRDGEAFPEASNALFLGSVLGADPLNCWLLLCWKADEFKWDLLSPFLFDMTSLSLPHVNNELHPQPETLKFFLENLPSPSPGTTTSSTWSPAPAQSACRPSPNLDHGARSSPLTRWKRHLRSGHSSSLTFQLLCGQPSMQ